MYFNSGSDKSQICSSLPSLSFFLNIDKSFIYTSKINLVQKLRVLKVFAGLLSFSTTFSPSMMVLLFSLFTSPKPFNRKVVINAASVRSHISTTFEDSGYFMKQFLLPPVNLM